MDMSLSIELLDQMNMEELRLWNNYFFWVTMNKPDEMTNEMSDLHTIVLSNLGESNEY